MIENLKKIIRDKKILILGFGKEGQSTYKLLRHYFPHQKYTIADADISVKDNILLKNEKANLDLIIGEHYLNKLDDYDLIIKTPGISLNKINQLVPFEKITSQTELFIKIFSKQIIGITGTKGKSTTTSLIYHIIHLFTDNVILVGNIGIPPFDVADKINTNTHIVYELSSHQLEYISVSPHISILLNLFQEHLDHYTSYETYQSAKFNIANYQQEEDFFIYNADNELIKNHTNKLSTKRNFYSYSLTDKTKQGCYINNNIITFCNNGNDEKVYDLSNKRHLKGEHNILNMMAAVNACKIIQIPNDVIVTGLSSFKGLPHRIEYVGMFNNIHFYNDSIATIPEATIVALKSLTEVDTLILGGYDRGIDYSGLINFINQTNITNFIFIAEAGIRILNEWKQQQIIKQHCFLVKTLDEAVKIAKENTKPQSTCLLSPAAASYGLFKNFEERGNIFKQLVKQ